MALKLIINLNDIEQDIAGKQAALHGFDSISAYVKRLLFPAQGFYELLVEDDESVGSLLQETIRRIKTTEKSTLTLKSLFTKQEWSAYSNGDRRKTGKTIFANRFALGLVDSGKDSSNQQLYRKKEDKTDGESSAN